MSIARTVPGFDAVTSDDGLGATLAVKHLLELGHNRILHLASPPTDGYPGRRKGYIQAMERVGLKPWTITCDYRRSTASAIVRPLLDSVDRPTAVFTHNDQTALGVLDVAHALGLKVPADISILGYDNTSASRLPGVNLTTVDLHPADLGRRAAEIAVLRSSNPAAEPMIEVFSPSLVVRASSGPPPRA